MDILTYALCRQYVNSTVSGLGALMGSSCKIDSIVDTGEANIVTFLWTGSDGVEKTSEMIVKHGVGIVDMTVDDTGLLTCTLSDGTTLNVGKISLGSSDCCNQDNCTCISSMVATDDDVDSLLGDIGLVETATLVLVDELNNYLADESGSVLIE